MTIIILENPFFVLCGILFTFRSRDLHAKYSKGIHFHGELIRCCLDVYVRVAVK